MRLSRYVDAPASSSLRGSGAPRHRMPMRQAVDRPDERSRQAWRVLHRSLRGADDRNHHFGAPRSLFRHRGLSGSGNGEHSSARGRSGKPGRGRGRRSDRVCRRVGGSAALRAPCIGHATRCVSRGGVVPRTRIRPGTDRARSGAPLCEHGLDERASGLRGASLRTGMDGVGRTATREGAVGICKRFERRLAPPVSRCDLTRRPWRTGMKQTIVGIFENRSGSPVRDRRPPGTVGHLRRTGLVVDGIFARSGGFLSTS